MEYMDEKILALINERREEEALDSGKETYKESPQRDVQQAFLKIQGEIIPFEGKNLLDDRIQVPLPATFTIMSPEIASLKYPFEKRPSVIYTNASSSITIAFNHTQHSLNDAGVDAFKEEMVRILKRTQPLARWLEDGIRKVEGKRIGFCDFLVPTLDMKLYHLLFFVELEGKALLCTFNCTEDEMKEWRPIARGIMDSLKICSNKKGDVRI